MKRRFEVITEDQWNKASARASLHEDIEQVFSYLAEEPEDRVRIRTTPGSAGEIKRHTLLEYARRRGVKLETVRPNDGWIYIRLRRAHASQEGANGLGRPRRGPRNFEVTTAAEWKQKEAAANKRKERTA